MLILWLLTPILPTRAAHPGNTSPPYPYDEAVDNGTFGYYPTSTFATEAEISAPKINWLQWDERCNDGTYYFLTPKGWGLSRPGPMILDWKGDLVWSQHFANEWGGQAYDFMVQYYQGQDRLTFWTGDDTVRGHGSGEYMILSSDYELVHSVDAANGLNADLHEFLLTPDGTALMSVYQKYEHDLSDWRTFNATADPNDANPGWIWDCVLQEIAVDTRDVIFEWRASNHTDINETYHLLRQAGNYEDPFDWFHMNSIRKDELGNYLVSARYTHSITYINGKTGGVIWTLGGKSNMFMDLSEGFAINFAWQHNAQFVSVDDFPETYKPPVAQLGYTTKLLSLFDNAAEDQNYIYGMDHSRGLLLEVTFPTPGHQSSSNAEAFDTTRDVSHLEKLAAESRQQSNTSFNKTRPNLPYPKYGQDKLQDPDVNRLKISQINSSNPSHTVRVIKTYSNPSGVRSSSQGSMQILPPAASSNNNINASKEEARVFVGYGLNAVFTEYNADSSVLCDAHFGAVTSWERGDIQSYRAFKFPWVGRPNYPPKMTIKLFAGDDDERELEREHEEEAEGKRQPNLTAYVSWNGATEVATWVLQMRNESMETNSSSTGSSSKTASPRDNTTNPWTEISRARKQGFETSLSIPASSLSTTNLNLLDKSANTTFFRILALDTTGTLLNHGITKTFNASEIILPEVLTETSSLSNGALIDGSSNSSPSPTRSFIGISLALLSALTLYELYRRYLCWKSGRGLGGAVRLRWPWWKVNRGYRLLSSSSSSSSSSMSAISEGGSSWSGRSASSSSSASSGGGSSWLGGEV